MLEIMKELGLFEAGDILIHLALTLAFFIGIMLIVSADAVYKLNQDCQKELGLKKRFWPRLESFKKSFVDQAVLRWPFWFGILISITAFMLLLVYRSCI